MTRNTSLLYSFSIICFILILCLHGLRTYQDAKDVYSAAKLELPSPLLEDSQFNHLRKEILNRPLFLDADSYYWVIYAKEMINEGKYRIRINKYDNVPYGREVHWHSGYMWFLIGLGKIYSIFNNIGLPEGIELAAGWSNPILIGFFSILWGIILARKVHPLLGGIFPAMILFMWSIQVKAMFAYVDHHILHSMLFLSQLFSIVIGGIGFVSVDNEPIIKTYKYRYMTPPYSRSEAKKWFFLAGLFGSMGLWVGATQQALLIGSIGIGGLLSAFVFHKGTRGHQQYNLQIIPELWRFWGRIGAVGSLIFYIIEYFPHHLSMRLEVNHPLYAVAWLAGSELLYLFISFYNSDLSNIDKIKYLAKIMLSLIGVLILPIVILWGPDSWHFIHNGSMRRIHDYIMEFKPPHLISNIKNYRLLVTFGLLPIYCYCLGGWYLFKSKPDEIYYRFMLIFGTAPLVILSSLYLLQIRWSSLLSVCFVFISIIIAALLLKRFHNRHYSSVFIIFSLLFLLLPGNYILIKETYSFDLSERLNSERFINLRNALLAREVSINMLDRTDNEDVRFISPNWYTPYLVFYGIGRGVGSLYWPNTDGMIDNVRFFSDFEDSTAKEIVKKRGITHVIIDRSDSRFPERVTWSMYGNKKQELIEKTLAFRLLNNSIDDVDWLEYLTMFYYPRARDAGTEIYQINEDLISRHQHRSILGH